VATIDTRALEAEVVPATALATHGRTFHWASLALGRRSASHVRAVYAFCRFADDLADRCEPAAARNGLDALLAELDRRESSVPAVRAFLETAASLQLDLEPARHLVRTLRLDLDPVSVRSMDELVRYAYGVAGTVGLMMCGVFGADDRRARAHALDLGIAMQLTNIARDVVEDARNGRVYLPETLLGRAVTAQEIADDSGDARSRARRAQLALLDLADGYYRSADAGLQFLPWRARVAVVVASRCYEAIGTKLRAPRFEHRAFATRAYVGPAKKAFHTLRGVTSLFSGVGGGSPDLRHRGDLHRGLEGLPGANASA
jgi:15-cis-phytoene synthase